MSKLRYLGLDVHAASIAVAVAESSGEVRLVGEIPNEPGAVRRLVKRLDHQNGQRASAAYCGGSIVGIPVSASGGWEASPTAGRFERAGEGDCLESAAPTARALLQAGGTGEDEAAGGNGGGAGVIGFYLGHRDTGGGRAKGTATARGVSSVART